MAFLLHLQAALRLHQRRRPLEILQTLAPLSTWLAAVPPRAAFVPAEPHWDPDTHGDADAYHHDHRGRGRGRGAYRGRGRGGPGPAHFADPAPRGHGRGRGGHHHSDPGHAVAAAATAHRGGGAAGGPSAHHHARPAPERDRIADNPADLVRWLQRLTAPRDGVPRELPQVWYELGGPNAANWQTAVQRAHAAANITLMDAVLRIVSDDYAVDAVNAHRDAVLLPVRDNFMPFCMAMCEYFMMPTVRMDNTSVRQVYMLLKLLRTLQRAFSAGVGKIPWLYIDPAAARVAESMTVSDDTKQEVRDLLEYLHSVRDFQAEQQRRAAAAAEDATRAERELREQLRRGIVPAAWRDMSVVPVVADMTDAPIGLPKLTHRVYASAHELLGTNFVLMKEDAIHGLREAVQSLTRGEPLPRVQQHATAYTAVRLWASNLQRSEGAEAHLRFKVPGARRHIDWERSKRFMPGSLLLLVPDAPAADADARLAGAIFATVARRDTTMLTEQSLVAVTVNAAGMMALIRAVTPFTMLESAVFFDSYAPPMRVLQQLGTPAMVLPFERTLTAQHRDIAAPAYLTAVPAALQAAGARRIGTPDEYDMEGTFPGFEDAMGSRRMRILQPWPAAADFDFGLDDSQVAALRTCLTQEVALIQGPPGTGKTHVGTLVAKVLLANSDRRREERPLVFVCYTNHALDQILQHMMKTESLVARVGGRAKDEAISNKSLASWRMRDEMQAVMRESRAEAVLRRWMRNNDPQVSTMSSATASAVDAVMAMQNAASLPASLRTTMHALDRVRAAVDALSPRQRAEWPDLLTAAGELFVEYDARLREDAADMMLCDENLRLCREALDNIEATAGERSLRPARRRGRGSYDQYDRWLHSDAYLTHTARFGADRVHAADVRARAGRVDADGYAFGRGLVVVPGRVDDNMDGFEAVGRVRRGADVAQAAARADDDADADRVLHDEVDEQLVHDMMNMRVVDDAADVPAAARAVRDAEAAPEDDAGDSEAADDADWVDDGDAGSDAGDINGPVRINDRNWEENTAAPWRLSLANRAALARLIVRAARTASEKLMAHVLWMHTQLSALVSKNKAAQDAAVLRKMRVVGFTTTGAAKYRDLLTALDPEILIVEEAAEILEAHVLGCLTPNLKHLILIGDHQQLRPKVDTYKLATHHSLQISLFERLIRSGVAHCTLTTQHRMRPSIRQLLTLSIYPVLRDHPTVSRYPPVTGMMHNLFFLTHTHPERGGEGDNVSRRNDFEADMVQGLTLHFLRNGYSAERITVLTMYSGQLLHVRQLFRAAAKAATGQTAYVVHKLNSVRVSTVDDYQGEENDIIILSLVRSNKEDTPGFLKEINRVCVALSRAKHGLFIIGNAELLERKVEAWRTIITHLRERGSVGDALTMQCQKHPDKRTQVRTLGDFRLIGEGGCQQRCGERRDCGHACLLLCHPQAHEDMPCMEPCPRTFTPCGHKCTQLCGKACGKCKTIVELAQPCGHTRRVACFERSTPPPSCPSTCARPLPCGHTCALPCGKACRPAQCPVAVAVALPCGHTQATPCGVAQAAGVAVLDAAAQAPLLAAEAARIACLTPCGQRLGCGHPCVGTCSSCHAGTAHIACSYPCSRTLVCGHACSSKHPCKTACPPCGQKCLLRCEHSSCPSTCGDVCVACVEPCAWNCAHFRCTRRCGEPCDRPRCNAACPRVLSCGHACFGVCGEQCPRVCRVCNADEQETLTFESYRDVERVIQLGCGHAFDLAEFDRFIDARSRDQERASAPDEDAATHAVGMWTCPSCRAPMQGVLRYKRELLHALEEVHMVSAVSSVTQTRTRILNAGRAGHAAGLEYCAKLLQTLRTKPRSGAYLMAAAMHVHFRVQLEAAGAPGPALAAAREDAASLRRDLRALHREGVIDNAQVYDMLRTPVVLSDVTAMLRLNPHGARSERERELLAKAAQLLRRTGGTVVDGTALSSEELERDMIRAVMTEHGGGAGHWYKCSNGHFYVIGECGGAMQQSKCPDCGVAVGGGSHRLTDGNVHAPEMDGSARAAWA